MSLTPWPEELAARYRSKGYWRGQTIGSLPAEWADRFGDRTAIVAGAERWSYRELDARSSRVAETLRAHGVDPGERVVVQLPNVADFFAVMFGVIEIGAIPVVVLPPYRRSEVSYFCTFTEAAAYVVADRHGGFDFRGLAAKVLEQAPALRQVFVVGDPGPYTRLDSAAATSDTADPHWADPDPGSTALLHISGGTTGVPKLIPRTHDDYLYGARASAKLCELDATTVYLCSLPVAHQFSLSAPGALGTFLSGGTVVLGARPAPDEAFALIERERVTVAAVVPPVAALWVHAASHGARDLSSLDLLQVGGAKLSPELARQVRPQLGCRVQQVFGMTEGLLNFTRLDDPDELVFTTQGRPLSPDDEIRVVDDDDADVPAGEAGHLLVRGPNTIRGYYEAPEHNARSFTADGFYRTGDIVRRQPTGHLTVVGRSKDQINRGGEKIAAEEIENHLLAHPGVAEVAVVSMPDPFLGEGVCAFVVASDRGADPRDLADFVRGRGLAASKVPDRIELLEELPRTAVGKISKQRLRERVAATTPAGAA